MSFIVGLPLLVDATTDPTVLCFCTLGAAVSLDGEAWAAARLHLQDDAPARAFILGDWFVPLGGLPRRFG